MILRSSHHGNVELRSEWGNESLVPLPGQGWISAAGLPVTEVAAFGLPAVASVIRSVAELIGAMPFLVYQDADVPTKARDSWQWTLLHEKPSVDVDSFEFWYDVAISLEAAQNAYVQKAKARNGEVVALTVLDPQTVRGYRDRDSGQKLFDVYLADGSVRKRLTTADILHVRGFTPKPGAAFGVSLIQMHRDPLGSSLAMQKFEGDYFRNYAVPPFFFTGAANKQQAQDLLDMHNANHAGAGKQWRVGALWGSTDVKPMTISLNDALFADAKRLSIEDVCRIWNWPKHLVQVLSTETRQDLDQLMAMIVKVNVLPRLRRIERAFAADPDIFEGSGMFGEFLTAGLERADLSSRYSAYLAARQAGWRTANEIRADENYPPHPDGDVLQMTPVGGKENPGLGTPNQTPPTPKTEPVTTKSNGHSEELRAGDLGPPVRIGGDD